MADITAIILTRNEEKKIGGCIDALKPVVKRIVVVDSYSEDQTVSIAKSKGAEVYQHEFYNYARQYQYAVDIADAQTMWTLKIDADEYLTVESAAEIERLCNKNMNTNVTGIVLRFCNNFMGKDLKHGGHYPWEKLSLYKTHYGKIEDRNMDEHIVLSEGKTIKTKKDSKHLAYKDLTFFINKHNWYSTREAMDFLNSKNTDLSNANFKTKIKMNVYYKLPMGMRAKLYYFYVYYLKLGFLDGKEGKMYAFFQAYWYRYLVDAKIYEHEKLGTELKSTGALK